jgi:Ca-activated chloride channel family protein
MIKRATSLALFAILAAASLPATVHAAERTMIVLDASGSMWGRIDGKAKLEIAREALKQVLGKLPASAEIGLMAYGHREKGNCADIEVVVPPAAGNAAKIGEAAGRMRFLGKTPLSEAVKQAAVSMRYTEEKATVILITDGIETCNADPCALGTELKKAGVGFTAHVVGFGLSREEGRQVACLAENTGGRYIPAGNENELKDALSRTVASGTAPPVVASGKAPPPKPAPAPLPKASVSTGARPAIGQSFPIQWTGPGAPGDYIDIMPPGSTAMNGELAYVYAKKDAGGEIRAPGKPGNYVLRYIWEGPDGRRILATTPITVGDAEVAIIAPASMPIGKTFEATWKGPNRQGDYIDIVPKGYTEVSGELAYYYVDHGQPARFKAPGTPGDYLLRYVLHGPDGLKVLTQVPLVVTDAEVKLSFPPRAEAGFDLTVHWRGPGGPGDYIDLVPVEHTDVSGELAYAYVERSEDGETATIRMPGAPGQYKIRYVLEGPGGRKVLYSEVITVTAASATVKTPATAAPGAAIRIEFTGPSVKGDYIDIVPEGQAEPSGELDYFYTERTSEGIATLKAPEKRGRYDIRYVLEASGGRRILARTTIEVR